MKKKLFLIIFLSTALSLAGCVANMPPVVISGGGRPLPPQRPLELYVYIWNETDYGLEIALKGPQGAKVIYLAGHEELLQPLTRGGEYRYFVSSSALGMIGEAEGRFIILPGRMDTYRGRVAGYHLIIRSLSWRSERSRRHFNAGPVGGEIKYGDRTEITGSIAGVRIPSRVILEGPASLISDILTRY